MLYGNLQLVRTTVHNKVILFFLSAKSLGCIVENFWKRHDFCSVAIKLNFQSLIVITESIDSIFA